MPAQMGLKSCVIENILLDHGFCLIMKMLMNNIVNKHFPFPVILLHPNYLSEIAHEYV